MPSTHKVSQNDEMLSPGDETYGVGGLKVQEVKSVSALS